MHDLMRGALHGGGLLYVMSRSHSMCIWLFQLQKLAEGRSKSMSAVLQVEIVLVCLSVDHDIMNERKSSSLESIFSFHDTLAPQLLLILRCRSDHHLLPAWHGHALARERLALSD